MPDIYTPDFSPTPNPLNVSRLQDRDQPHVRRIAQALPAVIVADPAGSALVDDIATAVNKRLRTKAGNGVPVGSVRRILVAVGVQMTRGEDVNRAVGIRLR